MSLLSDALSVLGRLVGLKPGPRVERIVDRHWVPPINTVQSWAVGHDTCFYCLAREGTEAFTRPCPRRRPKQVELA